MNTGDFDQLETINYELRHGGKICIPQESMIYNIPKSLKVLQFKYQY